ncbi:MAG: PAS domain S-box protein [Planctomycetes bacterium]|nr:PAS domain S-box protein [Planctomycetota bacterium]
MSSSETSRTPQRPTRSVTLPAAELAFLREAIGEAAGAEAAGDILFRLGRRLGRDFATRAGATATRAAMEQGLAGLADLGLGHATLEEFRLDPESRDCLVVGRVQDAQEAARARNGDPEPAGEVCAVTVGYLTGFTAALTGIDVVCSPFVCSQHCEGCGCTFEIRPAHHQAGVTQGSRAPSGSARFFLSTMGKGLADADIALDELVEHSSDAVILIDNDNVLRYWNRGAEQMFQYAREEVVGRKVGFLLPPDLLQADELGWIRQHLGAHQALRNHITRRVRKDGTELWVSLGRAVLYDSAGHVVGTTATIRDITEQRRTEQELSRSRSLAMVGELAAKIAHEVKNPLAGIYAAVQLLSRDVAGDDPRKQVFDSVGAEIRRLDDIVQDLLRFARPTPARLRAADLSTFVGEVIESLRHHPEVARHRVVQGIAENLTVTIDGRLLGQALLNLVLNAAQAMEEEGTVTVFGEARGQRAVLEVRDTGPGIPAPKLAEIFDPFFTTKTRGTGLGLSIARQSVQSCGGTLEAGNLPEGGAVFRIELPLARE